MSIPGNHIREFCIKKKNKTYRGGIPGKDMRVKESKELNELATLSGKPAKQVSDIIVSELLNNKIIEDIPDNWGCSVFDAISEEITEEQTAQCYTSISVALGVYVKKVFAIIPDLDLVGNGDCPECGGDMEVPDGEYRRTGGDGYITPPEYSPIWKEKTCRNCGYKESNEPIY